MNNRLLLILIVVTALVAGAAVLSLREEAELSGPGAGVPGVVGAPMFPALAAGVNEAARVEVSSSEGTFTLARTDAGWGLQSKGGYPVDFDRVKALVIGLMGLEVLEEKTSNPKYYARLGVEDIGPGATSKRVVVSDAAGNVLADVIVGNARANRAQGAGTGSLYVREHGAATSFEVSGELVVDGQPSSWLDKQIIKLDKQRVRQVEIRHPGGEVLIVERADVADAHFTARDFPADREPVWEGVADGIGGGLGWVALEDVGPALVDFAQHDITVTVFTCFDGYVVTAETVEVEDKTYLRLHGALDATQRTETVEVGPAAEPAPELPAEGAEAAGLTAAEVTAEAEALNAKVGTWIYEIPGYRAGDLRKHMDDLLKPLESEQAEAPSGDPMEGIPPEVLEQLQAQGLIDAEGHLIDPAQPEGSEEQH